MKKILKYLKYLVLFYIIYTPSIPGVTFLDKNVTIPTITILAILFNMIKKRRNNIRIDKTKLIFSGFILLADIYALIMFTLNNEFDFAESRIIQNLLPFCYLYLIPMFFAGKTKEEIFKLLINFAIFQGVLTVLMLLFPAFHNLSLSLFSMDNHFITDFRIYGIASDFTYATPIYHGFLAALLVYKWINKDERVNLIKLGLIVLTIVMNGRTGLLILFIDLIIFMIGYMIKKANIIKVVSYAIIGLLMAGLAYLGISSFLPQTSRFINRFINDTTSYLIEGDASGNYKILENSVTVPSGSELVFGKGVRLYKVDKTDSQYKKTDIGFINDIFLGGLVYACLMYFAYLYFMGKNIKDRLIVIVLIITMAIANIKGEAFRSSILIFMLLAIPIMENRLRNVYETE